MGNANHLGESEQGERQCLHERKRLIRRAAAAIDPVAHTRRIGDRTIWAAACAPRVTPSKRRPVTRTPHSWPPSASSSGAATGPARVKMRKLSSGKRAARDARKQQPLEN